MKSRCNHIVAVLLFCIAFYGTLFADLALAPENPYPAHGATGVQLQDLRLSWSQTQGEHNQPYQYQGFYIYASPKTITGYTYKFTNTGIHYYLSNNADTWTNAKTVANSNKWRIGCPWHEDIQNSMQANNEGVTTWIGFSDAATEGAFRWENGRSFSYTNWNTGEPNDAGGVEDYAEMFSNGKWNDAGSGSSRRYWIEVDSWISHTKVIGTNYYDLNCKLEPYTTYNWAVYTRNLSGYGPTSYWSFTTGGDGTAPSSYPAWGSPNNEAGPADPLNPTLTWAAVPGATYYKLYVFKSRSRLGTTVAFINGHVYQKTSTTLNYNDTRAAVEADGGHLVAINSQDEQDILPNDYNYWIGFHDPTGDGYSGEGWFSWDVGEPSAFYNWDLNYGPPEPNGQGSENYVIQGTAAGKLWYDVSGTGTHRSLYEYPADVLDGVVVNGTSYSFGETNLPANTLYRWIAVPYNEYGRPFFQSGQCSFYTTNSPGTAPGAISAITPSNGAVGVAINTELNWTPPTGNPTEYYAYLGTNNSIGNSANYTNLGIFNGHRYYKSNHGYNWLWAAANVQAQKDGGYLATMGTANENAISAGAENMWFGGLDLKATNIFKYANDDPWTYTSWYPGEPNNYSGTQYFTVQNWQNPGMWDDQGTDLPIKYVVEVAPNITDGERVTSANYTPPLLMFNTTYYWSAIGGNNAGMANDTQRWSFTTTDGKAVNPTPANGASGITDKVFDWSDIPGASGYLFYLGTANGTWDLVNGAACPTSTYTYVADYGFGLTYYWKVATVTPLETAQGNVWNFSSANYDYINGEEVVISPDLSVLVDGGHANNDPAPDPLPDWLNQNFEPAQTLNLTLLGAGPWTITITTSYDWAACYFGGQWHAQAAIGGEVVFEVPAAKDEDIPIIFGDEDPTLPVELSSFAATLTAELYVNLTWVSQSETDLSGYYVYRGKDTVLASAIRVSQLIEAGNTSQAVTYTFIDEEVEANNIYYYWLEASDLDGSTHFYGPVSVEVIDGGGVTPPPVLDLETGISMIFPNPFNPMTVVSYNVKIDAPVNISVYNHKGQLIRTLVNANKATGSHRVNWDGSDQNGKPCASGIYFIRMSSDRFVQTRKAVLMK